MKQVTLIAFTLLMLPASAAFTQQPVKGTPTSSSQPTSTNQPTYYAVSYGAKCDDKTNDSAAFAALLTAAKANCEDNSNVAEGQATVDLPPGKICKLNSGLSIDTSCISLRGNGAMLDFTGIPAGSAAITTTEKNSASPYNDNVAIIDLKLLGPGFSTSSGTVGLLSGSADATYVDLTAYGFNYGVKVSNYSWLNTWINPQLLNDGTGWYCPANLTDAGENMSILGGALANDAVGLDTEGCEVSSVSTSFDFETQSIANVGGDLRMVDSHVEFDTLSGALFNLSGANSFEYLTVEGGTWQSDSNENPADLATVNNTGYGGDGGWGPWAEIDNVFMVGLWPSATCASGNGFTCAIGGNAAEVKYLMDRDHQGNPLSSQPIQAGDAETEGNPIGQKVPAPGAFTKLHLIGYPFESLASVLTSNGDEVYCQDCQPTNPCVGGGSGALAVEINGSYVCN
jgi:hypothetical protein